VCGIDIKPFSTQNTVVVNSVNRTPLAAGEERSIVGYTLKASYESGYFPIIMQEHGCGREAKNPMT
jgi:hypothetical protein